MDFPLSEAGREQARRTGRYLSEQVAFAGIYTSPLTRALETAQIIARESSHETDVIPHHGLMERQGGVLEGLSWREHELRTPELVQKFRTLPEEERWSLVGAESTEAVLNRIQLALSQITARHHPPEPIVVVSHGGTLRALLRHLFPSKVQDNISIPNTSITRIWIGENPALLLPPFVEHLSVEK